MIGVISEEESHPLYKIHEREIHKRL